jgi:hypothetical protein
MKRNVWVFGLISGLLVSAFTVCSIGWCYSTGKFEGNMWLGYAGMLMSFSLVYVGVKNYRDKFNGGFITFGQALKIAFLMSLVASTCYVVVWVVDYYLFIPDFMEKFSAAALEKAQHSGLSPADLAKKRAEIAQAKEIYRTPAGVILFTYVEISPIAILVPLITALVLQKKNKQGQLATA